MYVSPCSHVATRQRTALDSMGRRLWPCRSNWGGSSISGMCRLVHMWLHAKKLHWTARGETCGHVGLIWGGGVEYVCVPPCSHMATCQKTALDSMGRHLWTCKSNRCRSVYVLGGGGLLTSIHVYAAAYA